MSPSPPPRPSKAARLSRVPALRPLKIASPAPVGRSYSSADAVILSREDDEGPHKRRAEVANRIDVKILKAILFFLVLLCLFAIAAMIGAHFNLHPLPSDAVADRIRVEKAARRLTLLRGDNILKTYRVALGGAPVGPKEQEGDQRTPEGLYRIDFHKADSDYHLALHISYPEQRDIDRAAAQGVPPGSDIMIHGIRNGCGWIGAFHRRSDWTAGCIAVTDFEIEEIFRAVPDGTPIEIRP